MADWREILPSRCTLGKSFCEGTCNAIGRRSGACEKGKVRNQILNIFHKPLFDHGKDD